MAKYNSVKVEECAAWVRINGLIDYGGAMLKDFCREMDINHDTYYDWMTKAEFSEAIKNAKEYYKSTLERRLVNSMVNLALGYEVEETKTEYVTGADGNPRIKSQTRTQKHIAGNTGANIFLLTNINPDKWKNKLNNEHSGEIDSKINFVVQSEEDKELIDQIRTKKKDAPDNGL